MKTESGNIRIKRKKQLKSDQLQGLELPLYPDASSDHTQRVNSLGLNTLEQSTEGFRSSFSEDKEDQEGNTETPSRKYSKKHTSRQFTAKQVATVPVLDLIPFEFETLREVKYYDISTWSSQVCDTLLDSYAEIAFPSPVGDAVYGAVISLSYVLLTNALILHNEDWKHMTLDDLYNLAINQIGTDNLRALHQLKPITNRPHEHLRKIMLGHLESFDIPDNVEQLEQPEGIFHVEISHNGSKRTFQMVNWTLTSDKAFKLLVFSLMHGLDYERLSLWIDCNVRPSWNDIQILRGLFY